MLQWNWTDKMGELTLIQNQDGEQCSFRIDIYDANCLAVFINEFKDTEGRDRYNLWFFLSDEAHAKRIIKANTNHRLLSTGVKGERIAHIKLNMWYKKANTLLKLLTRNGYKVSCYYKEPKKSK